MPTIRERNGKLHVQVRLKGHDPVTMTFPEGTTQWEAREWGLERERALKLGDTPTVHIKTLKEHTLGEMIVRFLADREKYPQKRKRSYGPEKRMLTGFMRREVGLCRKTLADIKTSDFAAYRDRRMASGVKSSTLRRELNPIRNILKVARREWDWPVTDPFKDLELPEHPHHRERVASREEIDRLCEGIKGGRYDERRVRLWIALIMTAVMLGMRRGELLNIEWRDIDFDKQTLNIRAEISKTRRSRLLPLCALSGLGLLAYRSLVPEEDRASNKRVFPLTTTAHEQAWHHICKRAKVTGLTFHDLRHTAGTEFDSTYGLTLSENRYMLGHDAGTTNQKYVHAKIESIRTKLDKQTLKIFQSEEYQRKAQERRDAGDETLGQIFERRMKQS